MKTKTTLIFLLFSIIISFSITHSRTVIASAITGVVKGKVQKVGFRAYLFKIAIQYNLSGYVQNLPD